MGDDHWLGYSEKGKTFGERKYPNSLKDVKRKLSFMNKKINELHHQRKFIYKNSVKVKKMVHNQVNQIVKCLRSRERSLWSVVDEAYISQDANISDELSRLQSMYAHCEVLFNHIEDFKAKTDVLARIYSILSEVNFGEKSDVKPLEFISDFEVMKTNANNYGYLEGHFIKKDNFAFVAEEKDNGTFDVNCEKFHHKEEILDQGLPSLNTDTATSKNCLEGTSYKETDCEDFQIIDLLDNMCCNDLDEDFIMAEDESLSCTPEAKTEFNGSSCGNESKYATKLFNNYEHPYAMHNSNKDFNPEEEWKQILEMNKKIASFHEMTSKISGEKQIQHKIKKIQADPKNRNKLYDNSCKQNRFLLLKEADNWLHNSKPKKDALEKEKTFEKISVEINTSPAELIQKAFKPYLTKGNIQNWLSSC